MRSASYFILFLVFSQFSECQNYPLGARNASMGNASVALGDSWSIFNNVGALGLQKDRAVMASFQNHFNIPSFQIMGVGYVHSFKKIKLGVGFLRLGDDWYNEQKINLAFSHQLGFVSLGVSVDYILYHIATLGSQNVVSVSFGGVAKISEKINLGAHIFNLSQSRFRLHEKEKLPTLMKMGLLFKPTKKFNLSIEVEKDLDFPELYKLGLEYQIIKNIFLRTGLNSAPFHATFGMGFQNKKWGFDYALVSKSAIGLIHEFSLKYAFSTL